jgi:hypothetical protein
MRLVERLDSDSLHALFDNYTTKSERKKRKKSEESRIEKKREEHHINYDCDKRHKRHEKEYVPSPKKQPPPQAPNSPQKRPAPSQADSPSKGVKCTKCGDTVEGLSSKLPKKRRICNVIGKICRPR